MAYRSRVAGSKLLKQEHELHIITNPFLNSDIHVLDNDDYQAPLTAHSLSRNSKWIIVRNNLHKIRSWGGINTEAVDPRCREWYILFQMRRELRRAQTRIQQIGRRPDFVPVHYFNLPVGETDIQRHNVSHVKPSDAIYYPSFGGDPIVLQPLLYYFSKECMVTHDSIFRSFLSDVCSVVDRNREHIRRVAVFRKVALTVTTIVSVILILMFFSLVLSVFTTASNLRDIYKDDPDGGIAWRHPEKTPKYL